MASEVVHGPDYQDCAGGVSEEDVIGGQGLHKVDDFGFAMGFSHFLVASIAFEVFVCKSGEVICFWETGESFEMLMPGKWFLMKRR